MIRSPPSPSSPSSPSRTNSPSTTNTKRSTFGITRSSSSSNRNGGSSLFSFGGGGGNSTPSSANTSPTHAFNSALNLPPSPGASHLREATFPFSSGGGGGTSSSTSSLSRPSFDNPSSTSALAPSPSLVSTSMFGRSSSKRLERKNTRVASSSRSGVDRSGFSASELDGMFDSYSSNGGGGPGSPGPGSLMGESMNSSDREGGMGSGALGAGEAVGLKRKGFFAEYVPKGEIGRQRYMWTEEGAQAPPPKRVLDIGSGPTSLWSIMQASQPGWETTQFVGLDIAPSEIPHDYLAYDISNRLSYVQHNFLEPLPFDDDRFDFVRIANVGLGVPEHMWAQLIEEATRVLSPGCHLEVVEHNFAVLRKRPLIKTPKAFSVAYQEDPDAVIDECFDAVLEERFINPHTIGMIPSQLALNCTNIQSSGLITLPLPSRPPAPARPPTPPSPTQPSASPQHSPLTSYSAGFASSSSPLTHLSPGLPHLYLAAYSDRFSSSSHAIASSAAARRQKRSGANGAEQRQRQDLLHLELDETVRGWAAELRERAGLASVVRNLWGWDCAMDGKMKDMLEDQLPVFDEKIRAFDAAYEDEGWQAVVGAHQPEGEWWDPEIEFRRAQVAFAKREATIELGRVKARLGEKEERDEEGGEDVGVLEMGTFVARAMA
ncbi:hypothetical protein BCR35DRAFT_204518 [Leucosporidium creatinivorum]|uniref:Methyltransferase domain-containing protein n=1 Tax=Leucosporidium creatinivorum TaxID=106004 RepID=A0A1Y2FYW1_9BASI|nr:hypothetical protein BCR35DRAFT_204518 [Leucosporidium creatinivorum]